MVRINWDAFSLQQLLGTVKLMVGMSGKANEPRGGAASSSKKQQQQQQLVPGGQSKAQQVCCSQFEL